MDSSDDPLQQLAWGIEKCREKSDLVWELFHENSKIGRYDYSISNEEALFWMTRLSESLSYDRAIQKPLPSSLCQLDTPLGEVLVQRRNATKINSIALSFKEIATILHYSYGVTQDNSNTSFPRSFRACPSAGALYPLEIYFYSSPHNEIKPGIYHYNPITNVISFIREGNFNNKIAEAVIYESVIKNAALILFITSVFDRSIFKYNNRGYRFALMEAGHLVQNVDLICTAMKLALVNIGGFYDREVDHFLGLDGINHSTIYMVSVGI